MVLYCRLQMEKCHWKPALSKSLRKSIPGPWSTSGPCLQLRAQSRTLTLLCCSCFGWCVALLCFKHSTITFRCYVRLQKTLERIFLDLASDRSSQTPQLETVLHCGTQMFRLPSALLTQVWRKLFSEESPQKIFGREDLPFSITVSCVFGDWLNHKMMDLGHKFKLQFSHFHKL